MYQLEPFSPVKSCAPVQPRSFRDGNECLRPPRSHNLARVARIRYYAIGPRAAASRLFSINALKSVFTYSDFDRGFQQ